MITTAVGSFPKVAAGSFGTKIIKAIGLWQRKELTGKGLEDTFRDVTKVVIKEQECAGLDLLTDGQVRWEDLITPIAKKLKGFEINGLTRYFDNNVYYRRPILRSKPKRNNAILVEDYRFAAGCTKKPVKVSLPGPYTFVKMSEDQYFGSEQKFVKEIAAILNAEALALDKAGAPFIQFDEPAVGFGRPDLKLILEGLKIATSGIKATTSVVSYFGSLNGALSVLMKSPVDVVGVDLVSNPEAFKALKKMKITKSLALGCVDARNTRLETSQDLHSIFRIIKRQIPLDCVYAQPNCGLEFLPHAQAVSKIKCLTKAVRTFKR